MLNSKNCINVEIAPNEENLTLLRLIASYVSSFLNFDIDEIDEVKVAITEIINYFKPFWESDVPFKFSISIENGALCTEINAHLISEEKVFIDRCNPELIIAKSLLDELDLDDEMFGNCQIKMLKKKRE
jgi:hypothetical protein